MSKVAFLDRDGLINVKAPEHDYIKKPEDLTLLSGAGEAIRLLNDKGYLVIIITNQRGIARGLMTLYDLTIVHEKLKDLLSAFGAHIDAIYFCPHDNGCCDCRKPDIGLFKKAEADFEIDKAQSFMIGDSDSDVKAGLNYGVRSYKTCDLLSTVKSIISNN